MLLNMIIFCIKYYDVIFKIATYSIIFPAKLYKINYAMKKLNYSDNFLWYIIILVFILI